jgi:hypothetical protein
MIQFGDIAPEPSGFESSDVQDIWLDGPGDKTVRPCPPEILPLLMAQRERMARWRKLIGDPEEPKGPGSEQRSA